MPWRAHCLSSRQANDELIIDENCTDLYTPNNRCASARMRYIDSSQTPACWNYNTSIVAGVPCRAPLDGAVISYCIEVGFTQNAWIVECGGAYSDDPHCGTFLEIHRPCKLSTAWAIAVAGHIGARALTCNVPPRASPLRRVLHPGDVLACVLRGMPQRITRRCRLPSCVAS